MNYKPKTNKMNKEQAEKRALELYPIHPVFDVDRLKPLREAYLKCWEDMNAKQSEKLQEQFGYEAQMRQFLSDNAPDLDVDPSDDAIEELRQLGKIAIKESTQPDQPQEQRVDEPNAFRFFTDHWSKKEKYTESDLIHFAVHYQAHVKNTQNQNK